ncbi:MAG: DUF2490 domain-containing protein [Bacteroidia bacterium]
MNKYWYIKQILKIKKHQSINLMVLTILIIFFHTQSIKSQVFELGSWNILNVKYKVNKNWSFFGETQLRSLKFYNNFHYYEYKGGIDYNGIQNLELSIGAGSYQTYKEGGDFVLPKNNDEFRIWPQIIFSQPFNKLKIEQRYRAELRFTSNGYRNRFRYRLGFSYPFGNKKNGYEKFQITASNEIFFTNQEPYFERNRMLVTLNYMIAKNTSVQLGYLHQFDYKINDETGRDFFQIGVFVELLKDNKNKPE